jgi:nitrite reductase/ring-hydroxylating ferredoxin subunit
MMHLLLALFCICCVVTNVYSWTIPTLSRVPLHQVKPMPQLLSATTTAAATTKDVPQSPLEYSWKDQWYVLTYANNVPDPSKSAEAIACAVFGEPLVLWREEIGGPIYCAKDVCPHRAAALSEGRVRNGTLQCLYHGWQFSGQDNGQCTRIPQLEPGAVIPKRACIDMKHCRVDEGMVWVWMGESAPTRDPPCTGILDVTGKAKKGWQVYDFMIDLPYDHSYLVENLLDPAHIAISHDRTSGGGKRESAAAYEMHVDPNSISSQGFEGKFRFAAGSVTNQPYIQFAFEAPGIVRNKFKRSMNGKEFEFGAGLHCMPVALGRSRLFFRVYNRGLPWFVKFILNLKPLWIRNLNSCKVLEQDVGLITTQEDHFARNPDRTLKLDYLMLKSSDTFVEAYRQWMDRVGHGMPWFQGLALSSGNPNRHVSTNTIPPGISLATHRASNQNVVETRYHRHVQHSRSTLAALHNIQKLKRWSIIIAGVALTTTCAIIPHTIVTKRLTLSMLSILRTATVTLPLACIAATLLHSLEQLFYVSYKRKDDLRRESGLVP